jgi:peptide/nickel transport system substrate-binding protein
MKQRSRQSSLKCMLVGMLVLTFVIVSCGPAATPTSAPPPPTEAPKATEAPTVAAVPTEVPTVAVAPTEAPTVAVAPTEEPTQVPEEGPTDGGTVNLMMWSSPDNLIPYYNLTNYARFVDDLIFSRLLKYDDQLNVVPSLAESYDVSEDGTSYTFHLRQDVKWQDGEPFTAADVEWTLKFLMEPDFSGTRYGNVKPIVGAEAYHNGESTEVPGIEVLDDYTIRLTTAEPFAPFLELVGTVLWILPKHIMADTPAAEMDKHWMSQTPTVGTGPCKFVQYVTDQYVELERNEEYYLGRPHIEKFIIKIVKPDVALAQFEKGELDATTYVGDMVPADLEKLQSLDNIRVVTMSNGQFQQMNINQRDPIFQDVRVRQAIVYAIDREAMGEQLLKGQAVIANGPIPPFSPYFNTDSLIYEYDPDKAKQLLEEAGWDSNQELVLAVPTGNVVRERSAPIIQQYLKAVGMNVELQSTDFTTMIQMANNEELDLWLSGIFSGVFDPDWFSILHSSQMPPAGWNGSFYSNPEADRLLEEGRTTVNPEERKAIYDELQMILAEDVPVVYLYYPLSIHVVSKRLNNAEPVPPGIEWNIQDWYLDEG